MEDVIKWLEAVQESTRAQFAQWPDAVLMTALLSAAIFLTILAFNPGHRYFKAAVLAYVLLP